MRINMDMLPNILTIGRIALTPIFIIFLFMEAEWSKPAALIIFIIAGITDAYDGRIARKRGLETKTGEFLDPLADKILVSSAFISFAIMDKIPYWMVVLIVFRDLFVTGLRMTFLRYGISMVTSKVAKLKTAAQISAILVILTVLSLKTIKFISSETFLQFIDRYDIVWYVALITTFFTVYTGINYLFSNRGAIRTFITTRK